MVVTISKVQDKYYLLPNAYNVAYTIQRSTGCGEDEVILSGLLSSSISNQLIPFPKDGRYILILTNNDDEEDDIITTTYYYYPGLESSIIEGVNDVLCGCGCCGDCTDNSQCIVLLNLFSKMSSYQYISGSLYGQNYLPLLIEQNRCLISDEVLCIVDKEIVTGNFEYSELMMKKLIALHYFAMYLNEILLADEDAPQITYVKAKFKVQEIFKCLKKLGLDITVPELI